MRGSCAMLFLAAVAMHRINSCVAIDPLPQFHGLAELRNNILPFHVYDHDDCKPTMMISDPLAGS